MTDIALYSRGAYRIVDLREQDRPCPWIVVDTAGAWLHEDVSFESARDWIDRREAQRLMAPARRLAMRPRSR